MTIIDFLSDMVIRSRDLNFPLAAKNFRGGKIQGKHQFYSGGFDNMEIKMIKVYKESTLESGKHCNDMQQITS